jgi:hypothetical protein
MDRESDAIIGSVYADKNGRYQCANTQRFGRGRSTLQNGNSERLPPHMKRQVWGERQLRKRLRPW